MTVLILVYGNIQKPFSFTRLIAIGRFHLSTIKNVSELKINSNDMCSDHVF